MTAKCAIKVITINNVTNMTKYVLYMKIHIVVHSPSSYNCPPTFTKAIKCRFTFSSRLGACNRREINIKFYCIKDFFFLLCHKQSSTQNYWCHLCQKHPHTTRIILKLNTNLSLSLLCTGFMRNTYTLKHKVGKEARDLQCNLWSMAQ